MLTGNKSETLPDKQTNTNYSLAWTNDITGDENLTGTLSIRHPHTADPNTPTVMKEDACSYGSTVLYTAGPKDAKETVIVTDDITGEYAELSYTVK